MTSALRHILKTLDTKILLEKNWLFNKANVLSKCIVLQLSYYNLQCFCHISKSPRDPLILSIINSLVLPWLCSKKCSYLKWHLIWFLTVRLSKYSPHASYVVSHKASTIIIFHQDSNISFHLSLLIFNSSPTPYFQIGKSALWSQEIVISTLTFPL